MKHSLIAIGVVSLSISAAFAGYTPECGKKRGLFKGRQSVAVFQDQFTTPRAPRSAPATVQRAYRDYLRLLELSPDFIKYGVEANMSRAFSNGRFIGYTIDFMAGDESGVTYYLDENEKFLAWFWSNQSPMSGWICEK